MVKIQHELREKAGTLHGGGYWDPKPVIKKGKDGIPTVDCANIRINEAISKEAGPGGKALRGVHARAARRRRRRTAPASRARSTPATSRGRPRRWTRSPARRRRSPARAPPAAGCPEARPTSRAATKPAAKPTTKPTTTTPPKAPAKPARSPRPPKPTAQVMTPCSAAAALLDEYARLVAEAQREEARRGPVARQALRAEYVAGLPRVRRSRATRSPARWSHALLRHRRARRPVVALRGRRAAGRGRAARRSSR